MKIRLFSIIVLFLTSCDPEINEPVKEEALNFTTSDASEIFFKNIRKSYYLVEERKEQGIDLYTFEDQNSDAYYPLIVVSIVHNWRNDNAFLMASPNTYIPQDARLLIDQDTMEIAQPNMTAQLLFLTKIYNAIVEEKTMQLLSQGDPLSFFDQQEDRDNFKTTLFDYYRLTGTF